MRKLLCEDAVIVVWALTEVELCSALWRRARAGEIKEGALRQAQSFFDDLLATANVVTSVPHVVKVSRRILATHQLRSADSLQLAAALLVAGDEPESLPFVTLDERLAEAAAREGFPVLPHSP